MKSFDYQNTDDTVTYNFTQARIVILLHLNCNKKNYS